MMINIQKLKIYSKRVLLIILFCILSLQPSRSQSLNYAEVFGEEVRIGKRQRPLKKKTGNGSNL